MKLEFKCPRCNKKTSVKSENHLGNKKFILLECGHINVKEKLQDKEISPILKDGRLLYNFQLDGVEFAKASDFRCLIADEMGLGKTIQVVSAFQNFPEILLPSLIVVKASLKIQWMRELYNGAGIISQILESYTEPLINDPRINISAYITSYDSLKNASWKEKLPYKSLILDECQMIKNHNAKRTQEVRNLVARKELIQEVIVSKEEKTKKLLKTETIALDLMKYHGISDRFTLEFFSHRSKALGITRCRVEGEGIIKGKIQLSKSHVENDSEDEVIETILHEIAHAITPGAGHVAFWSTTAKSIGSNGETYAWCPGSKEIKPEYDSVKYVIATSGTPIKNNAGEYFPILNLIKPEIFAEQTDFYRKYTNSYKTSFGWKVGGLRNPREFKEFTKDFIIRRNRKEVLPDLPEIRRSYRYTSFNEEIGKKYKTAALEMQDFLMNRDEQDENYQEHILAKMNRLRHLAGYGKIECVLDYIEEFLENEEGEKITIFHHHHDIAELMIIKLNEMGTAPLQLKAEFDSGKRSDIIDQFQRQEKSRILIAPTLACGEGLNLQFCSHAVIAEREWNASNEEQAEGRFSRIGSNADSIEVVYPVAVGSIDEMFAEIVERKRQYVSETLNGEASSTTWSQSDIMKELTQRMLSGDKRFSL